MVALLVFAISPQFQLPIADFQFVFGLRSRSNSRAVAVCLNWQLAIENLNLFSCLAWFQLDCNVGISNAFAFVSVGLSQLVHLRGDLAKLLLIDTR